MKTDELRRLNSGPFPGEQPQGIALMRFVSRCSGDAPTVLARCKEVMRVALAQDVERWPTDEEWISLLPSWFVAACADEATAEQQAQDWFKLSEEEKSRLESAPWSVSEWVYWFLPEQRQWFWWDASTLDVNRIEVSVEIYGDPFAWGSLEWLLRASGAVKTERDIHPFLVV